MFKWQVLNDLFIAFMFYSDDGVTAPERNVRTVLNIAVGVTIICTLIIGNVFFVFVCLWFIFKMNQKLADL